MPWLQVFTALFLGLSVLFAWRSWHAPDVGASLLRTMSEAVQLDLARLLRRSGNTLTVEVFLTRVILLVVSGCFLAILLPGYLSVVPLLLLVYLALRFRQGILLRQQEVAEEMPRLASSLSLAVAAGQDFTAALAFALQPQTLLGRECQEVLQALRLGRPRDEAFGSLGEVYPVMREFIAAIRLSESQGTPLSQVLSEQAQRARQRRVVDAETRAQRLPVLLLGPLALCIFPCVFIALLGPFLLDWL